MKLLLTLVIAALLALIWKLSEVVIRLESYSYAGQVGVCYESADYTKELAARERREACLRQTETRTSRLWHLLYALGVL